jgi:hypothetical protein
MSRRKWLVPGCAILAALVVLVVIASVPAALALRLAGFRSQGTTVDVLEKSGAAAAATIAWPATSAAGQETGAGVLPDASDSPSMDAVTVDLWFLAQPRTLPLDQLSAERWERGETEAGSPAYFIEFDERSANVQLAQWFGETIAQQSRLRNPWIDLRPGGAVIYADVNLEIGWKRVGAVLMVDGSGRQMQLIGVDIDGRLYSTPPDGQIAELIQRVESEANRALRELTFIDPAGELRIQVISVSEDQIQLLAY